MADIARQIQQRRPEANSAVIHHRIGKLRIGEFSVLVAVGTPHRAEGFAACQFAIDTLKHNAPIWKKEHWRDGSSAWVSMGACELSARGCWIPLQQAYLLGQAQLLTGRLAVLLNLLNQIRHRGKSPLCPDKALQRHLHLLTVEIACPIQQMHLDGVL